MKQLQASPAFDEVAKMLAAGEQTFWLIPILAHWSRLIGYRRPNADDDKDDTELLKAAQYLEKRLPTYAIVQEEFGLSVPDCVETILGVLPELTEFPEHQLRPPTKGGPKPDSKARLCAAVCAEVWRRERGKMQPFSTKLWGACDEYWRACGNSQTDTDWERYLTWVESANDDEFRDDFDRLIEKFSTTS